MSEIARHYVSIGANTDGLKSGIKSAEGSLNEFRKHVFEIGSAIGVAFGVTEIVKFGVESVKIAAQAEGIKTAFDKLNRPGFLAELQKAVGDTVDKVTLMKYAVRAENFKVPLDKLATFFKFAADRATQTGESVDYLVESIINGIGRKSSLVLDNLGISASELQKEIAKVGDFGQAAGNIIAREMAKSGTVADTTATKFDQLSAKMKNFQVSLGNYLIPSLLSLIEEFERLQKLINETSWEKPLALFSARPDKTLDDTISKMLADFNARGKSKPSNLVPSGIAGSSFSTPDDRDKALKDFTEQSDAIMKQIALQEQLDAINKQNYDFVLPALDDLIKKADDFNEINKSIIENGPIISEEDLSILQDAADKYQYLSTQMDLAKTASENYAIAGQYIANIFEGFAAAFTKGKNALQQFLDYFKKFAIQLIAEIAAIAAAAIVLSIVTGGNAGAIFKGLFSETPLGGAIEAGKTASKAVKISGKLAGGDINLINQQYDAQKSLNFG